MDFQQICETKCQPQPTVVHPLKKYESNWEFSLTPSISTLTQESGSEVSVL